MLIIYFTSGKESIGDDAAVDLITVTHANTTTTTGHRCKVIARAVAQAANASPHVNGIVDVIDVDNAIYFNELKTISSDSGFDIVVTLDVSSS